MTLANLGFHDLKAENGDPQGRHGPVEGARLIDALRREAFAHIAARRHRVLLVQADRDQGRRIKDVLLQTSLRMSFDIDIVTTGQDAIQALGQGDYEVCLVDWRLHASQQPAAILAALARMGLILPVIGLSRRNLPGAEIEALQLGIADVIDIEDLDARRLERAMRMAAHRQRTSFQLDRMAHLDPLTGLGNRTFFHDRLAHAVGQARLHGGELAIMLLKLEGFKTVNDGLGATAGDAVLRCIGERFKVRLRLSDTIARMGTDDFAFVIEGLQNVEGALTVGRKLLDAARQPILVQGQQVRIEARLGVARYPVDAEDPATLLRLADSAVYAARMEETREPRCHAPLRGGSTLGALSKTPLAALLREEMIQLRFEPQTPLASTRVGIGVVLGSPPSVPDFGSGSLASMIERPGMGEVLTRWLVERICLQARAWQKIYPTPFHITLPILSRHQLLWADMPSWLQDEMQRHGLPRAMLEIEIDERVLEEQMAAGGAVLTALRAAGMRLAITDFGRSSGPLRLLQDAPIQTIKLAAALTTPLMAKDEQAASLTRGLLHLAHDMRLRVVAEGATTREQLAFLRSLGCDAVQRTPLTRHLTAAACTAWLDANLQRPTGPLP